MSSIQKIVVVLAMAISFVLLACESDNTPNYSNTGVPHVEHCTNTDCLTGKSFPADDKGLIQMLTK